MILDIVKKGTTDYSCTMRIVDSTDGTPETGVVFNTSGIDLWYRRPGAVHTSITEATQTESGAHSDGGFVHISDGYYRLDLPDAALATGVDYVDVGGTVTGMVVIGGRIRLTDVDLSDGIRAGLTALPNASAGSAGGLPTDSTGKTSFNDITTTQVNTEADTALSDFFTSSAQLVDDVWDEVLNAAAHNVANSAGRRIRQLQDNGLYALAAVWVDEVSGTSTGTTDYEDATVTNRSNDFDNAQTVAASLGLNRIYPANGNSITLTATINNFQVGIPGGNWTLALGGQDIGGSDINDAVVSGICTGTDPHFHNCEIGAVTVPPCKMYDCGIVGTVTFGSAGNFDLIDCESLVAGSGAPVIDLGGAVGATNVSIRRWSGGLTLNNVATGDVISVDAISGGTITVNGTGGTVVVRGMVNVVDGSSGSVSITESSVVNMTKINNEVDTAISDASLATAAALATVDSNVDAILVDTGTTLPATLTTIEGKIDTADANIDTLNLGIITGAAAAGTLSTTQASTNLTGYADDQLIGRVVTWTSGACEGESTDITDYVETNGVLTFTALTTAPSASDTFKIT